MSKSQVQRFPFSVNLKLIFSLLDKVYWQEVFQPICLTPEPCIYLYILITCCQMRSPFIACRHVYLPQAPNAKVRSRSSYFDMTVTLWDIENYLSPLLVHRSHPAETHYFPLRLAPHRDILLHTHSPAPYIDTAMSGRGVYLDLLSSGGDNCRADVITLEIAWTATAGRWASRYFTTIISWAIGIVSLIMLELWRISDEGVGE